MSMSCFDCHDYMDGYNRGKKEGTIEELEKIRQEIYDIEEPDHEEVLKIIDKELAEMKGE